MTFLDSDDDNDSVNDNRKYAVVSRNLEQSTCKHCGEDIHLALPKAGVWAHNYSYRMKCGDLLPTASKRPVATPVDDYYDRRQDDGG